jgi:DNA-binding transcriptional ArsR family regulator
LTAAESEALLKILHHVLRRESLRILFEVEEPRSPSELADEIGAALGNIGYHVRYMEKYEALRLVGTEPVLGSLKHLYVPGILVIKNREFVDKILAADVNGDEAGGPD